MPYFPKKNKGEPHIVHPFKTIKIELSPDMQASTWRPICLGFSFQLFGPFLFFFFKIFYFIFRLNINLIKIIIELSLVNDSDHTFDMLSHNIQVIIFFLFWCLMHSFVPHFFLYKKYTISPYVINDLFCFI